MGVGRQFSSMASVSLQRLTPALKNAALDCIAESFTSKAGKEPFTWIMNLKKHHWKTMASIFVERACYQPLSVVAFNESTEKVEAVMLNEDWKEPPPQTFKAITGEWRPVRAV